MSLRETVSADTTEIDASESQLSQTVDQKKIEDLPLNGRSAYRVVQLSPGISSYSGTAVTGSYNGILFSSNGYAMTKTRSTSTVV